MKALYPWQQSQWQQLISQHQQSRLPHALLLTGTTGLGQTVFAQRFAHYLLCKQPSNGQACEECAGCRLILANNHPDLLSIFPEEEGKNIKVEQIRSLIFSLQQTAQRAGYQIAIIAPAEALNKAAANALLKTLEEPGTQVLLILISQQAGALAATITSRCQQIQFSSASSGADWLRAQCQTLNLKVDADLLLKIAEYAPLQALTLAQNNYLGLRDQLLTHLLAAATGKTSLLAPAADYAKQDTLLWVDIFISLIVDMVRLGLGVQATQVINHDRLPQLQLLTQQRQLSALTAVLTRLLEARRSLLNNQIHLNAQLLVESLLIYWNPRLS